jgi:hypothetical protein
MTPSSFVHTVLASGSSVRVIFSTFVRTILAAGGSVCVVFSTFVRTILAAGSSVRTSHFLIFEIFVSRLYGWVKREDHFRRLTAAHPQF